MLPKSREEPSSFRRSSTREVVRVRGREPHATAGTLSTKEERIQAGREIVEPRARKGMRVEGRDETKLNAVRATVTADTST